MWGLKVPSGFRTALCFLTLALSLCLAQMTTTHQMKLQTFLYHLIFPDPKYSTNSLRNMDSKNDSQKPMKNYAKFEGF